MERSGDPCGRPRPVPRPPLLQEHDLVDPGGQPLIQPLALNLAVIPPSGGGAEKRVHAHSDINIVPGYRK